MIRRLFNLAAIVSLLLGFAAVTAWARSSYYLDAWLIPHEHEYCTIRSARGKVMVAWSLREVDNITDFGAPGREFAGGWLSPHVMVMRAGAEHRRLNDIDPSFSWDGPMEIGREALVPYWWAGVLSAILPLLAIANWMRSRRRQARGCCAQCGYDLRATPDRCPECGVVPAAQPQRGGSL